MPWWSWIWVAIMFVMSVGGLFDDLKGSAPLVPSIISMASGLACCVFVLNHFGVLNLGTLEIPALIVLVVLVTDGLREFAKEEELTENQMKIVAVVYALIFAPAIGLAFVGGPG